MKNWRKYKAKLHLLESKRGGVPETHFVPTPWNAQRPKKNSFFSAHSHLVDNYYVKISFKMLKIERRFFEPDDTSTLI